jgi:hypothetical protein
MARLVLRPNFEDLPFEEQIVSIGQATAEGWYRANKRPGTQFIDKTFSDAVRNPVNGKMYTNRQQYEADIRSAGCRVVGNDLPTHDGFKVHEVKPTDGVLDASRRN